MTRISLVAMGDNVVDCYTDRGLMFPGGNAVNVSVFAAQRGASSSYIGRVANDPAGRLLRTALEEEGVDVSGLQTLPGTTAYCLIGLNDENDREFLGADLGVSMFSPTTEDLERLRHADAVHTSASSGLRESVHDMASRTRLSYDFGTRRDREAVDAVSAECFLASFSGGSLPDQEARELLDGAIGSGAEWVLVTRGAQGAWLANCDHLWTQPAASGEITDTLGAGDSAITSVLLGLLGEEAPEVVLSQAMTAAMETCGVNGAFGHPQGLDIKEEGTLNDGR